MRNAILHQLISAVKNPKRILRSENLGDINTQECPNGHPLYKVECYTICNIVTYKLLTDVL